MKKAVILLIYFHVTALRVCFAQFNTRFRYHFTTIMFHVSLAAQLIIFTWGRTRIFVFTAFDFCSLRVGTTHATNTFVFAITAWTRSSELKWEEQER